MSNFIGMVFATLKKEGIDTSGLDVNDAIAKYNEIKGADGGQSTKGEETPKATEKTAETGKEPAKADTEAPKDNSTISKKETVEDSKTQPAEQPKASQNEIYDNTKKDKYGNPMLSQKYHDIGKKAGQDYVDSMTKYNSMDKLIQSNVFPGYLSDEIRKGVNDASGDIPDITIDELENIVSEITGYKFNYNAYEGNKGDFSKYFSKSAKTPGTEDASKLQKSMGVSPDEAKSFAKGDGHLSKDGGYQGVSNAKNAPKFEYKSQEQNLSKEAEQWANTTLASTVKKTTTESLSKITGYWEEINKVQNDAYSAKMLEIYGNELKSRKK